MIVIALAMTMIALLTTLFVAGANGMRSSPGEFRGGAQIGVVWIVCALLWLAWVFR